MAEMTEEILGAVQRLSDFDDLLQDLGCQAFESNDSPYYESDDSLIEDSIVVADHFIDVWKDTRSNSQQAAERLMRAAGQEIRDTPGEPSEATRLLRAKLLWEEVVLELFKGLGVGIRIEFPFMDGTMSVNVCNAAASFEVDGQFDLIESIDALCDTNVVVAGTFSALGVPDKPFQEEVERSNDSKLLDDGTLPPHPTVEGKFGKGPNYEPPRIQEVLDELQYGELT